MHAPSVSLVQETARREYVQYQLNREWLERRRDLGRDTAASMDSCTPPRPPPQFARTTKATASREQCNRERLSVIADGGEGAREDRELRTKQDRSWLNEIHRLRPRSFAKPTAATTSREACNSERLDTIADGGQGAREDRELRTKKDRAWLRVSQENNIRFYIIFIIKKIKL